MRKTPLYDVHVREGGKMIEFHGWLLPLNYEAGVLKEHEIIRGKAGIFDVSHMGEIMVEGKDAGHYLQTMVTNNIDGAANGTCIYTPVCYPDGGTVDDILIYKLSDCRYMLVVNASNEEKDYEWFSGHASGDVRVINVSDVFAQFAIQGPNAEGIIQKLAEDDLSGINYYRFKEGVSLGEIKTMVSRTGYTGEDGFEIYVEKAKAEPLWNMIMEQGREEGLAPAGLGARDTLRLEAALPLYGNELSNEISPVEAMLGRFISFEKGDFIGRDALIAQKESPSGRRIACFEMVERGVPRSGCSVLAGGKETGFVTSGGYSPTLGKNIGMALIDSGSAGVGGEIHIVIRNKPIKAQIVKRPFYKRKKQ
jgi:aminomethyltransferase